MTSGPGAAPPLARVIDCDKTSRVNEFLVALESITQVARVAFLATAALVAAVCVTDWAVRTRRINPFSGVARFFRNSIDPLMAPIERRIVRRGGIPSNAPWWALAFVVVAGIVVIWLLGFIGMQAEMVAFASASGGRGYLRLIVQWIFGILQIALFARVISSWFNPSPSHWWVRWSYALTEPYLRPLRQLIPPIRGMIDLSPIVAYFALTLLSRLVIGAL